MKPDLLKAWEKEKLERLKGLNYFSPQEIEAFLKEQQALINENLCDNCNKKIDKQEP